MKKQRDKYVFIEPIRKLIEAYRGKRFLLD